VSNVILEICFAKQKFVKLGLWAEREEGRKCSGNEATKARWGWGFGNISGLWWAQCTKQFSFIGVAKKNRHEIAATTKRDFGSLQYLYADLPIELVNHKAKRRN